MFWLVRTQRKEGDELRATPKFAEVNASRGSRLGVFSTVVDFRG